MNGKEIIREELRGTLRDGEWKADRGKEKKPKNGDEKIRLVQIDMTLLIIYYQQSWVNCCH